jgi:hypothetical protein
MDGTKNGMLIISMPSGLNGDKRSIVRIRTSILLKRLSPILFVAIASYQACARGAGTDCTARAQTHCYAFRFSISANQIVYHAKPIASGKPFIKGES